MSHSATPPLPTTRPTADDAEAFVTAAEQRLAAVNVDQQRTEWVAENFITHDTQILAAQAHERSIALGVQLAKEATRFDGVHELDDDVRRKLALMGNALTTPGPSDPHHTAELARIGATMTAHYGSGKFTDRQGRVVYINEATRIMRTSRDPRELLETWSGWHSIARPMKGDYTRFVELTNEGARELGYDDTGALWRSKYDMPPDDYAAELERLWSEVRPLYVALHAYVRWNLTKAYGESIVAPGRLIPAHLLGNLWAQEWGNIYDVVAPRGVPARGHDLTEILQRRDDIDEAAMVRMAEGFFTSLGFAPLPQTFWERSLFVKPRDREVVCHASAWDIDDADDLRVKMCIEKTADDFTTIHHELGHNIYQRAYNTLPFLYRNSANDGFHEAVGDAIALSITPEYLVRIGLLDREPPLEADIALLLREALDKVAFLPFGLLIDRWRWDVFAGRIHPAEYNERWWELRREVQGIAPPVERSEAELDAGAKYHVTANVPYSRYFLARILQFQFHRALCRTAGLEGPLHRSSIYGNRAAGQRLQAMLAMGQSRPWPDALETLTGQRQMDASALLEYFAPLHRWLDEQNAGYEIGW
jgi:peptidyl-dipeptidase A